MVLTCDRFSRAFAAFEFQSNMDKVIRWPWTGVFKRKFAFVLGSDLLYLLVEFSLSVAFNQECSVHDHSIADRLVRTRCKGCVAQQRIDLSNVSVCLISQRLFDQSTQLHASKVSRACCL